MDSTNSAQISGRGRFRTCNHPRLIPPFPSSPVLLQFPPRRERVAISNKNSSGDENNNKKRWEKVTAVWAAVASAHTHTHARLPSRSRISQIVDYDPGGGILKTNKSSNHSMLQILAYFTASRLLMIMSCDVMSFDVECANCNCNWWAPARGCPSPAAGRSTWCPLQLVVAWWPLLE